MNHVLAVEPAVKAWAARFATKDHALFLGRGVHFPIAMEGALKLKEIAYLHAEGFPAGGLKHGPIALVEEGIPIFIVVPPQGRDQLHDKVVSNIQEIRARGARTLVIAQDGDHMVEPFADDEQRLFPRQQKMGPGGADRSQGAAPGRFRGQSRHGGPDGGDVLRSRAATAPQKVDSGTMEGDTTGSEFRRSHIEMGYPVRQPG